MSDTPIQHSYANAHVAWLVCLFAVTHKVRREGLMSIEGDIESPEHPASVFHRFPQVQEQPYLEFATDVLRMMVCGNINAAELQVYADHAIAGLIAGSSMFSGKVDESLLRTIWLTLWATMSGYAPQMAVEFGRQAVPVKLKPKFVELEELHKEMYRAARDTKRQPREGNLDEAAERFIASLGTA